MRRDLAGLLHEVADKVPAAPVPEDLFDRARARHRGRLAAAGGALAVVVLLLTLGYVIRPGGVGDPVADGRVRAGLPTRLASPPLWAATVGQSSPGAAAMLFSGPAVRDDWNEGRVAVVAAEADRYRVFDEFGFTPPGFEALLSPDGRFVWRGGLLHDLGNGDSRSDGVEGHPLAFSPDGQRLIHATAEPSSSGLSLAQDQYVGVYDLDREAEVLRVPVGATWVPPGTSAALSGDGKRLAVRVRDEVWLTRVADAGADHRAEPYLRVGLAGGRLAGPGAWLPDGGSVAVLERSACTRCPVPAYPRTWRLAVRDADTGRPVAGDPFPELPSTSFVRVLGWRSQDVAVALAGVPGPDARDLPDEHETAWGPYSEIGTEGVRLVLLRRGAAEAEVLFQTPPGIAELDVAAELAVSGAVRESGRPGYGPLHPHFLVGGLCLLVVVGVPAHVLVERWLRRRRRLRTAPPVTGR